MTKTKRASPGQREKEVAEALLLATRELGRGATVAELRDVHARLFEAINAGSYPDVLRRLEKKGLASTVGGRHRRTQWAHRDHPVPYEAGDDWAPSIIEIVTSLWEAQSAGAVETRQVSKALRGRGFADVTNDRVRTVLTSLSHESPRKAERSTSEWAEARIERIELVTSGGKRRVLWAPAGEEYSTPAFMDSRDAVRAGVGYAVAEAGMPLKRREIRFWAGAKASDAYADPTVREAAAVIMSPRFRQYLAGAVISDADSVHDARIREVRTSLTSRGMLGVRYAATSVMPAGQAACLVDQLAGLLRPQGELEGIERLRNEADELRSQGLLNLAEIRETSLAAALHRHVPVSADAQWLLDGCDTFEFATAVIHAWAKEAGAKPQSDHTAEVDGIRSLAARGRGSGAGADAIMTVDQSGGTPFAAFEGMAREAMALNGSDAQYWSPLVAPARRVRGPLAGGISATDVSDTQSFLDRPDAIHALVTACHLPRMSALIDAGLLAIGNVVRDADLLLSTLEKLPVHDGAARQAIATGIAMLGVLPPIELVWPEPNNVDGAYAYFAAVALAVDDPDERTELAMDAEFRAVGNAREAAQSAVLVIEAGARLSVVE